MKRTLAPLAAVLALIFNPAFAKAPPDATGECKDGTYTTSAKKEGACSSHGGVKTWLAKEDKSGKTAETDKPAKPADATGECKDGSYTTAASKSGACSGHKGVKTWYGKAEEKEAPAAKAASPAPAAKTPAATSSAAASAPAPKAATSAASERTAAAGGGAGKVWVNTDSKVYHCEKDALYGKTKQGEYMTEAQAKAAGARAARGKECS
jgi:hypothetical protein